MTSSKKKEVHKIENDGEVPAPPDGGYGWVIVFLTFISMFFVLGVTNSIGTLLDTLVQVYASCVKIHI